MDEPIRLVGKEALDTFVNPTRQRLIRIMRIEGAPMTAKQISREMGISASSVQHHMKRLEALDILEADHTESINGITARYFRLSDRMISIGSGASDEDIQQRMAILENNTGQVFEGLMRYLLKNKDNEENVLGDMLYGIMHLKEQEARELKTIITDFMQAHEKRGNEEAPWEFLLIAYPVAEERHA